MGEENTVYIGQKPTMNYVLATVTQFNGSSTTITIKARGRSISKAVDVALIVKDRFVPDCELQDISICTEVLNGDDGQPLKVSSIEISLSRPVVAPELVG
jgi:DNA-binding protein